LYYEADVSCLLKSHSENETLQEQNLIVEHDAIINFLNCDEPLKSHKNVTLLTKRKIYYILNTDIIKISLSVRDDK